MSSTGIDIDDIDLNPPSQNKLVPREAKCTDLEEGTGNNFFHRVASCQNEEKAFASLKSVQKDPDLWSEIKPELNEKNYSGCTPLALAARKGNFRIFSELVRLGAIVDSRQFPTTGNTLLHEATHGLKNALSIIEMIKKRYPDKFRAMLTKKNIIGQTPLNRAQKRPQSFRTKFENIVLQYFKENPQPPKEEATATAAPESPTTGPETMRAQETTPHEQPFSTPIAAVITRPLPRKNNGDDSASLYPAND